MPWMQKLYETYERCKGREPPGSDPLPPINHTTQQAQIEIVLDGLGNFRRANIIEKADARTLIPCTEKSGGRSGTKPENHPLCDKLQYIAADFCRYGGEVTSGFAGDPGRPHRDYMTTLTAWARSNHSHSKLRAIVNYLEKGHVIADLVRERILHVDNPTADQPKLLKAWPRERGDLPHIFKVLSNNQTPSDAFVRWRVEEAGNPASATWDDQDLIDSWIKYYESQKSHLGLCMVSGCERALAEQHPAKLRNDADKAKLVSSNDKSGFTFRGRFVDADQAAGVSYEVTQKAHNALQWLIRRQGHRSKDARAPQIVVAWTVTGKEIPDPLGNSFELFGPESPGDDGTPADVGDVGQAFARRLSRAIAGYRANLGPTDDIIVMGLDSATPGRMAISFYRELKRSEFLDRIEEWHRRYSWPQNFGKDLHFVGSPAPAEIAEAAYGKRIDDELQKATVERLLPCIVDARSVPIDLVVSAVRRASNRAGAARWQWEKCLGVACSLFKGYYADRSYQMSLETERSTRDYLYGRLLAIAEAIEGRALYVAKENRDTNAARLMQRFAERPFSTWRTIELALCPYRTRLRASRAPFLHMMEVRLDEVMAAFSMREFEDDSALSGEFLLGYHCERSDLRSSAQREKNKQHSDK
jgi:CRISPR-associated protein Csd1